MSCYNGQVGKSANEREGCDDSTHADKARTSCSEVSLELPEVELSYPSSSESDEIEGARKVPLLRGELKG